MRDDDGELAAAGAPDFVGLAQAFLEQPREPLEHAVAGGMAVGLVDRPEVVDVDQREAELGVVA